MIREVNAPHLHPNNIKCTPPKRRDAPQNRPSIKVTVYSQHCEPKKISVRKTQKPQRFLGFFVPFFKVEFKRYHFPKTTFGEDLNYIPGLLGADFAIIFAESAPFFVFLIVKCLCLGRLRIHFMRNLLIAIKINVRSFLAQRMKYYERCW